MIISINLAKKTLIYSNLTMLLFCCFSIAYDAKAKDDNICSNDAPMAVASGKPKDNVNIRYTYSVNWIVSNNEIRSTSDL